MLACTREIRTVVRQPCPVYLFSQTDTSIGDRIANSIIDFLLGTARAQTPPKLNKVRPHAGPIVQKAPGAADGRFSPTGQYRVDAQGNPRPHIGVDIAGKVGDPIVTAADGTVVISCPATTCRLSGNQVSVEHPDGTVSRYFHLGSIGVSQGAQVSAGDQIGTLGTTGNAVGTTQPHLHWEVRQGTWSGVPEDPDAWLKR